MHCLGTCWRCRAIDTCRGKKGCQNSKKSSHVVSPSVVDIAQRRRPHLKRLNLQRLIRLSIGLLCPKPWLGEQLLKLGATNRRFGLSHQIGQRPRTHLHEPFHVRMSRPTGASVYLPLLADWQTANLRRLSVGRTDLVHATKDHLHRDARRRRAWPSGAAAKSFERRQAWITKAIGLADLASPTLCRY